MKPAVSAAALVSAVALSASARDFRPDMSFENVPAGDGSVQQCLVFPTTPGVGYRAEWSHDLTDWTTDEEVYGLGFDFVVAMREFTPPPPPPEPGSGDPPPPVTTPSLRASLVLREASGETPGIIVSWKSLDHGGPMKRFLPLVMTENWTQMPFYWRTFDDCDFFITALGNPVEPPTRTCRWEPRTRK